MSADTRGQVLICLFTAAAPWPGPQGCSYIPKRATKGSLGCFGVQQNTDLVVGAQAWVGARCGDVEQLPGEGAPQHWSSIQGKLFLAPGNRK